MKNRVTRRQTLKLFGTGIAAACFSSGLAFSASTELRTKAIPGSGRKLPVIGLGTWQTFNVGSDQKLLDARTEVIKAFIAHGGALVDSSPMYGSSPDTIGYALERLGQPDSLFAAEKVWSPAGGTAREQVNRLSGRWGVQRFALVQVHNLNDWREHLEVLRAMKAAGEIGYVGITTSHGRRHREAERIMASEAIDFVQLTYNISHREADERLLPLAKEKGLAVIANRPYDGGGLIKGLKGRGENVPEWAARECGCRSWADFLLKFIVSHPAVTCTIPATTRVDHLNENMLAGHAPMPSATARRRMIKHIESL